MRFSTRCYKRAASDHVTGVPHDLAKPISDYSIFSCFIATSLAKNWIKLNSTNIVRYENACPHEI